MKRSSKILFTTLSTLATMLVLCGMAFAQGSEIETMRAQGLASNYGLIALAAGLGIGIAALGGGIGNPNAAGQIRGPMILGLALIESLVIYALIIALLLVLKVGA